MRKYISQLNNIKTFNMYLRQMMSLAENVLILDNLPTFMDSAFVNKTLVKNGSIAFFEDEELGVLALPYSVEGKLDVYGRPISIRVTGSNGYTQVLKNNDFVIMYDNNGRYPLWIDIIQYAERMALDTRTIDINIAQQKTPRFFKTTTGNEKSISDLLNNIDTFENAVVTYENLALLDDTTAVLAPAPYVADKIDIQKDKIWAEFLRLIGVSNLSFQKKERNISDEISAMQGGTIASRYTRFEPRKKAVEDINKKFGLNITVEYFDGVPTDKKDENIEDEEGDEDV